jgi:PAS domain S-box-containing protein
MALLLGWTLIPQLALAAAGSTLTALVLLRSGRIRLAMFLALVGISYAVMHAAARNDGINNIGLLIFPVLIVLGGLLLEGVAVILFTAGVVLVTLGMLAIRYFVLRMEEYNRNDIGDFFVFALICAVAALAGRLLAVRVKEGFRSIRESETRYRRIFESVQDVYYEMDIDGILLEVSPASAEMFGVPREKMIGQSLASHCAMGSELDAMLAAVRTEGQVLNRELVIRDSRATLRHFLINASLQTGPSNGEERVIGSIRDITELKQSEEKFVRAFRSSPAAATLNDLDDESRLIEVNEAFERLTGYRRDEVIGRSTQELGLWADPHAYADAVRQARANGRVSEFEFRFRRKSGDVGIGLTSAELIELEGRTCAITSTIDITDRKRTEAEKGRLAEQLRQAQKLESIGRLAGGVAHDVNNLITVMDGYSALLLKNLNPDDALRSHASEITRAVEQVAGLTNQLLAFSRGQVIHPIVLDLNGVVTDMVGLLRRLIGEHIEIVTVLDPSLGQVMADPGQIQQVLMNLAANARDAMTDGGRLQLETRNVDVDEQAAAANPDAVPGRSILLTVSDSGIGMDEETLQHAFEPFFTTKEHGKGTGLGLSSVYGIIRQSGGWIEVCSQLHKGTSFRIYLPCIDAQPVSKQRAAAPPMEPGGNETLLLVEDQDALRRMVRTVLASYGYNVLEASDGQMASVLAKEYPGEIALLLTDLVLPGTNGKDLSEQLRLSRPGLKTLLMSGWAPEAALSRGELKSGVAFIAKPFTPAVLAAEVREVLAAG